MSTPSPAQRRMLDIYAAEPSTIDRRLYKETACGGHATFREDGSIDIGTIVEGSDACFNERIPPDATKTDIRKAIRRMERFADEAWREANGAP